MDDDLATLFEADRPRLQAMAFRMLGSLTEAEDAVQETWIRLSGTDSERIDNLGGWLFAVPYEEVGSLLGRSSAATCQLASRARRRVQGVGEMPSDDRRRQHEIVDAFLAASREGKYEALMALLDPDAVLRADRAAVELSIANRDRGAPILAPEVRGRGGVVSALIGRATAALPALVEGMPGAVWAPAGRPRAAFVFYVVGDTIAEVEIVTDRAVVAALEIEILGSPGATA